MNEFEVGKYYMSEYGICVYIGISDGMNLFRYRGLNWFVPLDSDRTIMETTVTRVTKFMKPLEFDQWIMHLQPVVA